ncbi:CHAP domain-containing protein [Dongia deserti]|uniref:CHAP domain-containing protein n=1 Tax=Dongia deserti TaxID=2268030 RepID=UPI002548C624|nr:CHAP domain-containing protein [Dongia deserti]
MKADPAIARHGWKRRVGHLAALLLLAGCAIPKPPSATVTVPVQEQPQQAALQTIEPGMGAQCVPYARARSGIGIFGDAYTWWETAAGRYERGSQPLVGSVLVLRKTSRLRHGHLGVVSAVVGPREIRVDHANWQPGAVITNMAVTDISPANDWTQLRFWNQEAQVWGSVYPAAGFIYNLPDGVSPPKGTSTTIISRNRNVTH